MEVQRKPIDLHCPDEGVNVKIEVDHKGAVANNPKEGHSVVGVCVKAGAGNTGIITESVDCYTVGKPSDSQWSVVPTPYKGSECKDISYVMYYFEENVVVFPDSPGHGEDEVVVDENGEIIKDTSGLGTRESGLLADTGLNLVLITGLAVLATVVGGWRIFTR
jgi:hypothetical protein